MRQLLIGAVLFLAACTGKPSLDDPALGDRDLNLEEFFQGETVARGQFQDIFGTVRRRFDVTIDGDWDGRTLTLTEDFLYSDGETEQRIWRITRTGEGTYEGRADDVVGVANGVARGKALNWSYDLMLKVGDSRIKVSFNDWMFLQPDGVLINKADVSKFGITIGTVTLFFQKGARPESASSGRRKTAA